MLDSVLRAPSLSALRRVLQEERNLLLEGLWDAPKACVASIALEVTGKNVLFLTARSQEENRLFEDFAQFSPEHVLEFPAWETMPSEGIPPSPDIVGERYSVLQRLRQAKRPQIILSNLQACLQKLIPPTLCDILSLHIRAGQEIPYDTVIAHLGRMGYIRHSVATDKGQFAVRGGIIDIFPVTTPAPYRLEYWGDEVESLRIYDPISQRSVETKTELGITPAVELEFLQSLPHLSNFLDYLSPNTLVVFDDLEALEERYVRLLEIPGTLSRTFSSLGDFFDHISGMQRLYFSEQEIERLSEIKQRKKTVQFRCFEKDLEAERVVHPFESINDTLRPLDWPPQEPLNADAILSSLEDYPGIDLKILSPSPSEESALKDKIEDLSVQLPHDTAFISGYLSSGFFLAEDKELVLPLTELTRRYRIRRQKQRSAYHSVPSEMYDLAVGDYVVHVHHGIGRYLGVEERPNHEGNPTEYFLIEYDKQAKLFIPLTQAHLISKYIGGSEAAPKLHIIGGGQWKRAKGRTEKAIMNYASDLLKIYAERKVRGGYSYPKDGEEVEQFDKDFPFEETEDQILAIQAIKADMCSARCMDRLICGDVGYGKTEVAMRAAFKAVMDGGKQVAILVPTTVLALQHYENFLARMEHFPIHIAVLSRFGTAKQTKKTLEDVAAGRVDIVIGTHRLISQDVLFKNLGLVIIDEEQRFGVKAKEHLKKIKVGVDTLALSATPIPRTLYLSLLGARDMSVINTPPQDRLPIRSIVAETDNAGIKNALLRELTRDGQVFFIHNRVDSIHHRAAQLKKLVPKATILVGHGQMKSEELDEIFHTFKNGKADILVATTIVESGIDIPNANTIIIDRADCFGLADLYQLRGRVGRWNRRAYAYFLTPKSKQVTNTANKRLEALLESSGFGGGMKIAMRDLEIRGGGDILGTEQSGHVVAVGFHLYCKLLKRTIDALQGTLPSVICDTKIEFPHDARLPNSYVNAPSLRMDIYQRLGDAINFEDVDKIWTELKDRFGHPPEQVKWLYHWTRVRVFAARNSFTLLKLEKVTLVAERKEGPKQNTKRIAVGVIKDPQDLERKLIRGLKKGFNIK